MRDESEKLGITQLEWREIFDELVEQPAWRHIADMEMDYADGNQLDGDLLRRMKELGYPPAVEDEIGPALLSLQGYESASRTDWRVTANGQPSGQEIADALNFRLNQAERESKADDALSKAFRTQIACGIGWVEVAKQSDPFRYPYRCKPIHRNEIHWDMRSEDIDEWRWLRRQRWIKPDRLAMVFPDHAELIRTCGTRGANWWTAIDMDNLDGGQSTGLQNAWGESRAWTMQEEYWYNPTANELCVSELWYRRWVTVPVLKTPDGRVVEYDRNNERHVAAVASGAIQPTMATVTRVRRAFWLGPHLLHDGPTPYPHRHFPYVPLFGFLEDNTRVPYGYVRSMKYAQDSLNSGLSKLRWAMSVVRTERTKGAVAMTDAQLRKQIARPDADIVLDADHMARPGARFDVKRDYQLSDQHLGLINDSRAAIQRVSGITPGFQGRSGTARSGLQEQTQVEQSNQALQTVMDNFRAGRRMVGELLLSLIIEDIGSEQQTIIIEGDAVRADRTVVINRPEQDPVTGMTYLSNDLQRTRLMVSLEDVPSTPSFRGQQLNAMSETIKSLPQQYQAAMTPFLVSLMDVPFKRDVVDALRAVDAGNSPEAVEQRIKQEVAQALKLAGNDLKARELDIKERKTDAEIDAIIAKAVQTGVASAFSAMQAAGQIVAMPQIAPIADIVMQSAGYQAPSPAGQDPNYPQPQPMPGVMPDVQQNTSPQFPPIPDDGVSPMQGIETTTNADNMAGAAQ